MKYLLILLLLTGCSTVPVEIIYHDTYAETTEAYGDVYHFKGRTIGGFINWINGVCEVHVSLEAPNLKRCIEHEIAHCHFGAYHGDEHVRDC